MSKIENIIDNSSNSLPIIGIVPTYKVEDGSIELPDRYVKAVAASGGAPVVLPFTRDVRVYETLLPNIDGFLLSGGQDIDPVRYGQEVTYGKVDEVSLDRDEVEHLILSFARQYNVPLLGICRGMQMINVAFGGTLYQDLGEESQREGHWQTAEYNKPTHHVQLASTSKLASILGVEDVFVNSMHHQGVRELAPGLMAAAYGEDGLVEAVEALGLSFMIGVQWHPEFFAGHVEPCDATDMTPIFDTLVKEAGFAKNRAKRRRSCLHILSEDRGGCFPLIQFD